MQVHQQCKKAFQVLHFDSSFHYTSATDFYSSAIDTLQSQLLMALLNTLLSHIILMSPYIDWMFLIPTVQSSLWKSEWNCVQIDNAVTDIDSTQMGHEFYCDTFFSTIPKLLHFTLWDKTSFAIVIKKVNNEQKSLLTCTELSWKPFVLYTVKM